MTQKSTGTGKWVVPRYSPTTGNAKDIKQFVCHDCRDRVIDAYMLWCAVDATFGDPNCCNVGHETTVYCGDCVGKRVKRYRDSVSLDTIPELVVVYLSRSSERSVYNFGQG
jgi:hypothetical protein